MTPTLPCPEDGCGGELRLLTGRHGPFYGCSRYPGCDCTHSAHADGRPMGVPATKAVRAQRTVAHQEFDRLWCRKTEGNKRRRTRAYRWMAHVLGLPPEEAHISRFDGAQCDALLSAVRHLLESYPDYAVGPVLLAPQFAPSEGENAESAGLPDWPAWDNCPRRAS